MSLPERTFRNGQEPAISEVIMNEIYSNIREDQKKIEAHETKIAEIDGNIPFPFAVQNGKYGYIKKVAGADTFIPFSTGSGGDGKLYTSIPNQLANKLTVLSSFSCTESSEKYDITVIPSLTPTEENTTA